MAVYSELSKLVKELRVLVYEKYDISLAKLLIPKMESLLGRLPDDDGSLIAAEAYAIFYELLDDTQRAIRFRKLEINRINALHADVSKYKYDPATLEYILQDRNWPDIRLRLKILATLEASAT